MSDVENYKMLESSVWKLLDLLDSEGIVEETGQKFPLASIRAFSNTHTQKIDDILNDLRIASNHKSDKKYQEKYTITKV